MAEIKSPLRYPGGKAKAVPKIVQYIPIEFSEYREPFVGGGSLFLHLRQRDPNLKVWINDLNFDLYCFWVCAQSQMTDLLKEIWTIKNSQVGGRDLFKAMVQSDLESLSALDRAVRFFVLNRITFSGTVDCGGFSQKAFETRFTNSSIDRLARLEALLDGVLITNLDYLEVIKSAGNNVFIFLDPPYLSATKSKLYGKRGDLHTSFNHQVFAEKMEQCEHQWLITYDDSEEIRENFKFARIYEWEVQYGMNNYMREFAAKGKEVFICNYESCALQPKQLSILGV